MKTKMYPGAKTWSPFKGCSWDCTYCAPTFKAQAKRQKHICRLCYDYTPHEHPERLAKMPSAKIIFVGGNADECFRPHLANMPSTVTLVTTLETNRSRGYGKISKAPAPLTRYRQFKALEYPRKVITAEPVLDFDPDRFASMIIDVAPDYLWLGYNSKDGWLRPPVRAALGQCALARPFF